MDKFTSRHALNPQTVLPIIGRGGWALQKPGPLRNKGLDLAMWQFAGDLDLGASWDNPRGRVFGKGGKGRLGPQEAEVWI